VAPEIELEWEEGPVENEEDEDDQEESHCPIVTVAVPRKAPVGAIDISWTAGGAGLNRP
jgi:hypothetical protein